MAKDFFPSDASVGKLSPGDEFHDLIETVYRVFTRPKPATHGVCVRCCMEPDIEADFLNPDIRDLPAHYMRNWFDAAHDYPLPKSVWAYLLPRILEMLACGQSPSNLAVEVSLNRFPTGDFQQWSRAEWAVLDRFQRQFLMSVAGSGRGQGAFRLDDVLCMFANAGWPIGELLDQIANLPDALLATRLAGDWQYDSGAGAIWMTGFWGEAQREQVRQFYTSKNLLDRMTALMLNPEMPWQLAQQAGFVAATIRARV